MPEQNRVAELKSLMQDRLDTIQRGADNAIKVDGENTYISAEDAKSVRQAMAEVEEIKCLIEAESYGEKMAAWMREPTNESVAMHSQINDRPQVKSLGEMFTDSDEFKALDGGRAGLTMGKPFEIDSADVVSLGNGFYGYGKKDVYSGLSTQTISMGVGTVVQFDPTVPRPQRPTRVRDLFPAAATSANLIDFFRVTGFAENGGRGAAAPVPERDTSVTPNVFGLKPKSTLQFTSDQAPVRTIAHWEAAHRNVLADTPQLQNVINNELLYGLALEEDDQILNGDGTNENLRGILATPGILAYTQANDGATPPVATETKPDALRRAATLVMLAYYDPTGYVMHPYDWEDIELTKDSQGRYILVTNITIGAQAQVWRQPVVATSAMNEGTFLSGAFGLGAQLYDRQQASVRVSESHEDFFVRNAVAILCEERLALAVKRPESFVKGSFIS